MEYRQTPSNALYPSNSQSGLGFEIDRRRRILPSKKFRSSGRCFGAEFGGLNGARAPGQALGDRAQRRGVDAALQHVVRRCYMVLCNAAFEHALLFRERTRSKNRANYQLFICIYLYK